MVVTHCLVLLLHMKLNMRKDLKYNRMVFIKALGELNVKHFSCSREKNKIEIT